jgi:spermidine synthase
MTSFNRILFYALFFVSGVAGLGYEILWTRMLSVGLGHEIISVLAVVSAFFCGLAAGAWVLDRPVSKSANPEKWYALLEVIIGLWALALIFILPELNRFVSNLIGAEPSIWRHWSISFLYPLVILLPATAAMGGTLPAMDRIFEKIGSERNAVAGLYSINTLGAVTGTLLVTFWFLPSMGMNHTSTVLVLANFTGAMGILAMTRKQTRKAKPETKISEIIHGDRILYIVLFITGLLGIGFEVIIVRALSQILENTVFSFASMLMVFLLGTAAGAAIYHRAGKGRDNYRGLLSLLLMCTALFCLISIYGLRYVDLVFGGLRQLMGDGFSGAVFTEITLSLAFFLLPTISMGATFSHLVRSLRDQNGGVGHALCLNTLGGACAPLLFGVFLLPRIGIHYTLLTIPAAYLLCFPRRRIVYAAAAASLSIAVILLALKSDPYRLLTLKESETVVNHREGIMASVSVVKDSRGGLHLKVNNHFQMGGTTSVFSDKRQAYLPLLLHPSPKQALFLGVGTGATFAAAADFPELMGEGVELIPEVIEVMDHFEKVTGAFEKMKNLRILNADARRYVTATETKYDVVVADLFHPSRDGAGSLYTREHFSAIRDRLTDDGLFCQWLPLYQLDLETFKIIVRTFLQVYPNGQAFLAHYSIDQPIIGLVGGTKALRFPEKWYRQQLSSSSMRRHMAGFGYDSIYSLLGTFMAGSDTLRQYAGHGPINTDEAPVVLFRAPLFVYGSPDPANDRLLAILDAFSSPDPEAILAEVVTEEDHVARLRLTAYWSARDSFLKLGTTIDRTTDVTRLYATASQPLLKVVRQSLDFSAAYFPLISIAYELYPHDRDASYQLLRDLERANPMRPEAGRLRQRLFVKRPS